jgi:hypothetical protein
MNFEELEEDILTEAAALTKGSQRVMNDKKLVMNLADAVRDDAASHPHNFPPNSKKTFQKASDEEVAQWFLENIDKIEKEGYEGTIYSRDGVYADWIVRRYIAGSHNWEDLIGVMNMNLRDWTLLKNRNMLDPNHRDVPKFNSVRDIGKYMTTHYADKLEKIRDAAKNAARNKMAKSVKLVDNEDYRIYTTLNRAAGCALGLGTQWCTANSVSSTNYHNYAGRGMLFQLFPYVKEEKDGEIINATDEEGKPILNDKTKYQFDAGGKDFSPNFMDITDTPVKPAQVAQKFPYLYTDLAKALKANKTKMEAAFKEMSADPTLQADDFKIKTYEIDEEIQKLHKFVERGYFTDQVRPKAKGSSAEEPAGDQPQALPAPQQPQGNPQMENVDKDVAAMLDSLKKYDKLVESVAPVMGMVTLGEKKGDLPPWLKDKKAGPEDSADGEGSDTDAKKDDEKVDEATLTELSKDTVKSYKDKVDNDPWRQASKPDQQDKGKAAAAKRLDKEEVKEGADEEVLAWMKRFANLGKMG